MQIEDQVCSLELAKRLKELGVNKKSIFVWEYFDKKTYAVKFIPYAVVPDDFNHFKLYPAFTSAELGEMLPANLDENGKIRPLKISRCINWHIYYEEYSKHLWLQERTEANARAEMLIFLIENNLVKAEDLK